MGESRPHAGTRSAVAVMLAMVLGLGSVWVAGATILTVTNEIERVPLPPPSVEWDTYESDTSIRAFDESVVTTLSDDLAVDLTEPGTYNATTGAPGPSSIPSGTAVSSHFLHADRVGRPTGNTPSIAGTVSFDAAIVGVVIFDDALNASDYLGAPGTVYPAPGSVAGLRGFDWPAVATSNDEITIAADRRSVTVSLEPRSVLDQVRVLTAATTGPGIRYPYDIAAGPDDAMWFTNSGNNSIGRITTSGSVSTFTGPSISNPLSIVDGPDGAMWFTNNGNDSIGRITTSGTVTNFTGSGICNPYGIAAGSDGALWFTNYCRTSIGRITTSGSLSYFTAPTFSGPYDISAGSDGAMWFTNFGSNSIGRITTSGSVSTFAGAGISYAWKITAGPDGALWFTNAGLNNISIGRITTSGSVSNFSGSGISSPYGIAAGPDGAVWFTNWANNSIGRMTTSGTVSTFTPAGTNDPLGIAAGPDNAVWFTNYLGHSIGKIGPAVVPGAVSITEGNAGTKIANVPVTLNRPGNVAVSVNWTTLNNTAVAPGDYTAASGTVIFAPGQTTQTVPITIKGDTTSEPDEIALVAFSAPTNATLGGFYGLGVATIIDDDRPALKVNDVTITEGNTGAKNLNFTVSLSRAATGTVSVKYATQNGTATTPGDYTARSGTLYFVPGKTALAVMVPIVGETVHEANETLFLKLSSASTNARIADAIGTGTIINND